MTVDDISDLDLSCTPPLGSPWDVIQIATQAWTGDHPAPVQPAMGALETSPAGAPAAATDPVNNAASPGNAPGAIR